MKKYNDFSKGFSLLELSIVLVVIGLLFGGILAGKSLARNAAIKSMISEVNNLKSAIGQFKLIYKGLPGDITNATGVNGYWSSGTMNGDGDGQIDIETSNEPFAALDQLNLANLLSSVYAGTWGSGFVLGAASGDNVISSKLPQAGIYARCCSTTDYSRSLDFKNHVNVFAVYTGDATRRMGVVSPVEAYSIDVKMDDGNPDLGFVGGSGSWTGAAYAATDCYTNTGSSATYDTAVANKKNLLGCQMHFAYDW
ncbi:prepilin-type N-terminal cleavage/methylation domain-containing protein [Rickettsiales bacterium]|nr:prepilin-type N-terminal cleavage/methylation domain-containing protein [Rickettsiales bacterium]